MNHDPGVGGGDGVGGGVREREVVATLLSVEDHKARSSVVHSLVVSSSFAHAYKAV